MLLSLKHAPEWWQSLVPKFNQARVGNSQCLCQKCVMYVNICILNLVFRVLKVSFGLYQYSTGSSRGWHANFLFRNRALFRVCGGQWHVGKRGSVYETTTGLIISHVNFRPKILASL